MTMRFEDFITKSSEELITKYCNGNIWWKTFFWWLLKKRPASQCVQQRCISHHKKQNNAVFYLYKNTYVKIPISCVLDVVFFWTMLKEHFHVLSEFGLITTVCLYKFVIINIFCTHKWLTSMLCYYIYFVNIMCIVNGHKYKHVHN